MTNSRDVLADRIGGAFWIVFGAALIVMALGMDIPEHLGATFLNGPGFVPMLLGGALCLLGTILILRTRSGNLAAFLDPPGSAREWRAIAALALMLVYSVGLVGRAPFAPSTAAFIAVFIIVFNLPAAGARDLAKLAAKAAVTAAVTTAAVVYVFQNLFYVRLP